VGKAVKLVVEHSLQYYVHICSELVAGQVNV
jgi:hypothetical protein